MKTTSETPDQTYLKLQQRADAAATQQRGRPREAHGAALDRAHAEQLQRHGAPVTTPHVSVRDTVLPAEHAERLASQPLAASLTKWLTIYPPPTATTPPRLAKAVRDLHDAIVAAQAASNPEPIQVLMDRIDAVAADVDSPVARAVTFYKFAVLPQLGRGRAVPGAVAHVEALVQQLPTIMAEVEAAGVPASDPILYSVTDAVAPTPRRAVSGLSHE